MRNPNRIKASRELITITVVGAQSLESIDLTIKSVQTKIRSLRRKGRKVLIFIDISAPGSHDSAARRRAKDFFKLDYDRIAVYRAKRQLYNLIRFLAGPKYFKKIHFFHSQRKAVKWLESDGWHKPSPGIIFLRSRPVLLAMIAALGLMLTTIVAARIHYQNVHQAASRAATVSDATATTIQEKTDVYLSAMYGFRGLFESSELVTQSEFRSYFIALDLNRRLPGITAVSYIREVPVTAQEAVVEQIRSDTSIKDSPLQNFTISHQNPGDTLYPITYLEPGTSNPASFGFDLGSLPDRLNDFHTAKAKHGVAVSHTSDLVAGGKPNGERGFIMIMHENGGHNDTQSGYIDAVFAYNKFFNNIPELSAGTFQILDSTKQTIYGPRNPPAGSELLSTSWVNLAGRHWTIKLYGNDTFGLSPLERISPLLTFLTGILATGLLTFAFFSLLRSREAAYALAEQITEDLRVAEHQHSLMIDSVRDYAIYMIDPSGRVATWNSGAELIKGYKAGEIIGRKITLFYPKENRPIVRKLLKTAAEQGRVESVGWRVRKDGTQFWARVVISAVRDDDGHLLGFTKVTQDMTEQLELEKQRENFVAIATHELNTPLTSLKAYTQALQLRFQKAKDIDSAQLLGKMDSQLNRLVRLVHDLLDASKIENGRLEFRKESVHLDPIVQDIVQELSLTTDKHKLVVSGSIPGTVYADANRLGQVFTNIIENAIKHSADTSTIRVKLEQKTDHATISIIDHGPGIRKQDQTQIFQRFFRTAESNHSSGFGLGLYISEQIIKSHGGSIRVHSEPGKGSTFTISLPLEK